MRDHGCLQKTIRKIPDSTIATLYYFVNVFKMGWGWGVLELINSYVAPAINKYEKDLVTN